MTARTRDELLGFLYEQIGFLAVSNAAFDAGHRAEAKRLALAVRVLFHHTFHPTHRPRGSHALVNQLGLESDLTWVDTAGVPDPTNLVSTHGLTYFALTGSQARYEATLGDYPPSPILARSGHRIPPGSRIPFDEWWTNPVIKDSDETEFSRFKLVRALANKEGGAHVNPGAEADYEALAKLNSLGWRYSVGGEEPQPITENVVYPSMRQISYEVVESLRQQRDRIK